MLGMSVPVQLTKMRNSAEAVATIAREKQIKTQGQGQQVAKDFDLTTIMEQLQRDYADYKYTVYRCASKLVALQKIFHTGKIPYKLLLAILERHNLNGGGLELMVPPFQLTSLLHDVYFASEKLGHFQQDSSSYQLERSTSLLANFFWNVYDPHRRHSISLLEIKITFILLCKLFSSDHLIGDFFALLADPKSQIISRYAFEQLLSTLGKLLGYLGESKAYGLHNLPLALEQSFARCPHGVGGLTESQFHKLWTAGQTRFLIYGNLLSLVKRIEDTESLIHSNSCAGCRREHIVGIRFRCQVCRDVSLCLPCFAVGFAGGRHEPGHRMCEVFVEDQPPLRWTRHLARLCGWLTMPGRKTQPEEERRGFCNAQESGAASVVTPIPAETRSVRSQCQEKDRTVILQQQELCSLTGLASKASSRLQSIIDRLLLQNAKLESQLQTVQTASSSEISLFLSAHQSFLLQIIEDMRQLSHSSVAASPPLPAPPVAPPVAPLVSSTFLSSSTPQRQIFDMYAPVGANLTHSINGADLNRSYLEANKSDYSLNDISLWFDQRRSSVQPGPGSLPAPLPLPMPLGALLEQKQQPTNGGDTEMVNFKLLLHKVKEIVEDSYSDNAELSAATQNLENVLDSIIKGEEQHRRIST
ncbi:uncharacterized protein dah [Drosophila takahashii]|uniref:uncharacterized protein dah n=1 Tax=Drosophila takahashii TaxID=29030 RepID=UPI001CF80FA0|nr:uncharacterized protein LOC108060329 [Drosophila takahashii]